MKTQKVVLVTGCSSGFGMLTAVRLAARGHFVWATMRDLARKGDLERQLSAHDAQVSLRQMDVTDPASIKKVIDEIKGTHAHIDVLINNAGYGVAGFFEDLGQDEIRAQMETNFFGVQNTCREVIPLMRARQSGKIINISSIAGRVATPCLGAYASSKWALEAFSEALYYELGLFGISVVLVEPGSYPTKIFSGNAGYAKNFNDPQSPYFSFSQRLKHIVQSNTRKLKKDPNDVARQIEGIVDNPHPRLRYVSDAGSWSRMMAQRHVPPVLLAQIFRRFAHGK